MRDGCITTEYVIDYDPIVRIAELELLRDEARELAEEWRDYCERECVPHHSRCAEPPPETLPWEVME